MAELIQVNGERIRAKPFRKQGIITDDHGIPWIAKVGDIVVDHWSLLPGWTEPGYEPMSKWHIEMQKKFADIGFQLEITRKSGEEEVKRADCYCEVRKLVVEIQKSHISETQAIERTEFWNSLGYDVMWIFHEERTYSNAERRDTSPLCFSSAPKYLQLSGMATVLFQDCNGDFNVIMDYIELRKGVKKSYRHCVAYVKHSLHDVLTLIVDDLEIATTGDIGLEYYEWELRQIEAEKEEERRRQRAIEIEKQRALDAIEIEKQRALDILKAKERREEEKEEIRALALKVKSLLNITDNRFPKEIEDTEVSSESIISCLVTGNRAIFICYYPNERIKKLVARWCEKKYLVTIISVGHVDPEDMARLGKYESEVRGDRLIRCQLSFVEDGWYRYVPYAIRILSEFSGKIDIYALGEETRFYYSRTNTDRRGNEWHNAGAERHLLERDWIKDITSIKPGQKNFFLNNIS